MGKLTILGTEGHAELAYDPAVPATIPPATDRFKELRAEGFHAFRITPEPEAPDEPITEFDPDAGEIVMFPQVQGG